jgi:hypothetical protein
MKRRILSLALTVVLVLALAVPAAFAAPKPDEAFTAEWLGAELRTVVITPHDYVGDTTIGNLFYESEKLFPYEFAVFVVDDSVSTFEVQSYTTKRTTDFVAGWGDEDGVNYSGLYLSDGKANISDGTSPKKEKATKEDPFHFYFSTTRISMIGDIEISWAPQQFARYVYNTSGDHIGQIGYAAIVFRKSQIVEFQKTGKLPPLMGDDYDEWGYKDLSSYVDLTELETLLKNYKLGDIPAPTVPTVSPTASTVSVNGEAKEFEAYNIGGNNFFKLRDLAYVLNGTAKQFNVGYDNATKAITLTSGEAYIAVGGELTPGDGKAKPANPTTSKVYLDGRELVLTAYNIGGNNFFKLRDLMQALDVYVGYENTTRAITITTDWGYVAP